MKKFYIFLIIIICIKNNLYSADIPKQQQALQIVSLNNIINDSTKENLIQNIILILDSNNENITPKLITMFDNELYDNNKYDDELLKKIFEDLKKDLEKEENEINDQNITDENSIKDLKKMQNKIKKEKIEKITKLFLLQKNKLKNKESEQISNIDFLTLCIKNIYDFEKNKEKQSQIAGSLDKKLNYTIVEDNLFLYGIIYNVVSLHKGINKEINKNFKYNKLFENNNVFIELIKDVLSIAIEIYNEIHAIEQIAISPIKQKELNIEQNNNLSKNESKNIATPIEIKNKINFKEEKIKYENKITEKIKGFQFEIEKLKKEEKIFQNSPNEILKKNYSGIDTLINDLFKYFNELPKEENNNKNDNENPIEKENIENIIKSIEQKINNLDEEVKILRNVELKIKEDKLQNELQNELQKFINQKNNIISNMNDHIKNLKLVIGSVNTSLNKINESFSGE